MMHVPFKSPFNLVIYALSIGLRAVCAGGVRDKLQAFSTVRRGVFNVLDLLAFIKVAAHQPYKQ